MFSEVLTDADLNVSKLLHEGMEYARTLSPDNSGYSLYEYLYAVAHGNQGKVNVYVGIDLDAKLQTVFSTK